ncbi:hypothetical protein GLOTRDRAFT_129959 [Gloeophyllum trabeum ATCC 11539]|uniref:DUF7053 domain-containing protein n=1 Tax=Gloeophyllum trabeum (strain ATCC 11539 / FP-39264 / Madison 617) TaxID=670483 RepID=S7Q522_GLOTA|nr:uncharacterized protein GLOTRDRAFT_129959 [Gloeophyllum trabeum ATCC 11539]EPQ54607.1 hypothetical protein GLOTRDRAFT_129959 [Gloeophyllum trabeum ATCC 11539]
MSTKFTHTIVKPLPAGVAKASVLRLLHDHALLIRLNPLVAAHALTSAAPERETYTVTDRIPVLFWEGTTTYTASFADTPDGVRTRIKAMGLVSEGEFTVEERQEGLVLLERAEVTCPWVVRWFVEGKMRESHTALVERFAEKVKEL